MRKVIGISLLLCVCIATRGQTGYEYDYWFDNNRATIQTGQSESASWHIEADVSQLDEALHTLHVQVRNPKGVSTTPVSYYFIKSPERSSSHFRYWFDQDSSYVNTESLTDMVGFLDTDNLLEGFHILHVQVEGSTGGLSVPFSRPFIKVPERSSSHFRYWFDQDSSYVKTESLIDEVGFINVAYLQDGFHTLHIQVEGSTGGLSVPVSHPFIKVPEVMFTDYLTCRFIIDGEFYKQELVSSRGGTALLDLDVADLSPGLHRLYIQVLTPSGTVTATYSKFFLRVITDKELAGLKCYYAFDNGNLSAQEGSLIGKTNHFDIDVSHLKDGEHHITYYLSNGSDIAVLSQDADFLKYIRGDVNSDGYIDVADLSGVVHFILEIPTEKLIFAAADLDENETVDVNDFSGMANLILDQAQERNNVKAYRIPALEEHLINVSNLKLDEQGEGELLVSLEDNRHFTGLQFDLDLPEGVCLIENGVQSEDKNHHCWSIQHADGSYRVMVASMNNAELSEDPVLRLSLKGNSNGVGTANLNNIILTDANATRYTAASVQSEISGTTHLASIDGQELTISISKGLLNMSSTINQIVRVVSLSGGIVAEVPLSAGQSSSINLPAGIYIVNNKKIIIR